MDSDRKTNEKPQALNIRCFQIILRECVQKKDLSELPKFLHSYSLLSKQQRKTFKGHLDKDEHKTEKPNQKAFSYLFDAFDKREEFTFLNIIEALNCEEFPVDAQVKQLLSYVIGGTNTDLLKIIEKWDNISRLEGTLKKKALEISSEECWVKTLVLAAFDEVLKDDVKILLNTINDELNKQVNQTSSRVVSAPESDQVAGEAGSGSAMSNTETRDGEKRDKGSSASDLTNEKTKTAVSSPDSTESGNLGGNSGIKLPSETDAVKKGNSGGDVSDNSMSKAKESKIDGPPKGEISRNDDESTIYILPADEVDPVPDEKECWVEFRAVPSYSTPLPEGKALHMAFEESKWIPIEMAFNKYKEYYFLRILFHAKHTDEFQFKFGYYHGDKFEYEQLPSFEHFANRKINLKTMKRNHSTISQNVCCFDKNYGEWMKKACDGMKKFLPDANSIVKTENSENTAQLLQDLLTWFDTMSRGWKIRNYVHCPHDKITNIILPWLKNISKALNDGSNIELQRPTLALFICISFCKNNVGLHSVETYKILMEMLTVHQLTKSDCEKIHEKCISAFTKVQQTGLKLPLVREVMHQLYNKLDRYSLSNWILTLPLYWLFVHGEVRDEVVDEDLRKGPLLGRASLPVTKLINWDHIRRQIRQNDYIEMADTIVKMAEIHPWIVKTYLSILRIAEVVNLVVKNNDVVRLFQLDDMVLIFLEYKKINPFQKKNEQSDAFKEYFQMRLDIAIISASQSETDKQESDVKSSLKCCLAILDHVNNFAKAQARQILNPHQICWLIDATLLKTINWITTLQKQQDEEHQLQRGFNEFLENVTTGIYRRDVSKNDIEFWTEILNISWGVESLDRRWQEKILHEIQNSINNFANLKKKNEEFLDFFVTALDGITLHPDVEKFFSEKAYAVTVLLLQKAENKDGSFIRRVGNYFQGLSRSRIIPIFGKLFMREYDKISLKSSSVQTRALLLTCNWMFSTQFFQLFSYEWLADFSSESRKTVQLVIKSFLEVVHSILNSYVIVEHLRIISKNTDTFLLLCALLDKSSPVDSSSKSNVANQISMFLSHLETFEQTRTLVKDFVLVCNYVDYGNLPPPHATLDRKFKLDISHQPIHDLVAIDEWKKPSSTLFFGITESHLIEFEQIRFLKGSRKLFKQMFTDAITDALSTHQEGLSLDDVMAIWAMLKSVLFKLVSDIDSGKIFISDVINTFGILNGSKADINYEVELLYNFSTFDRDNENDFKNKAQRKLQIFNAFELQQTRQTMDVLLGLRQLLGLRGDFKKLLTQKNILENQSTTTLAEVPDALKMSAVAAITPKQIEILEKFMASKRVIVWLREKMEGMNEVKVMCDLAMISAGEDAVEVGRVSCLLSASMGFAPLIFWDDAKRQEEVVPTRKNSMPGLKELVNRCKEVWKNIQKDEKILDDWEEADRQLNWFKDVEKFYGSVEKSSLTRAQEINERGVYVISKRKGERKLTLESSLSLAIVKDKGTSQTLTLEVLRELQSKLMLIAGDAEKGRHDVNVFIEVLASVEKLAEVFVMLELSGCMLFSGWTAVIACKGSSDGGANNLSIQIIFSDEAPPLIGQGSHIDLDKITEILKESLSKWEEHVASKRTEHYYLNEFNINQIMFLCRELSKFEATNEIPDQVKMLLSFVRQDFSEDELRDSLEAARMALDSHCAGESDESSEEEDEDDGDDEDGMKRARRFGKAVKILLSDDVPELQAKAAVLASDCDLADCQLWILENQHDAVMIERLAEEFDETFGHLLNRKAEVIKSAFQRSTHNTLRDVIARLQNESTVSDHETTLQDSIKTICIGYLDEAVMMDLQDHLSIGLLGETISNLSIDSPIKRSKLPGLRQGRPNLIICGEQEIFFTAISMYMKDAEQPLPNRSEVLVCTELTTKDDVERFVRRALGTCQTKGKLVYTLAFADNLNYTNSVAFVEMYNKCLKYADLDENFQLILLLNKQQHFLATYFYKDIMNKKWTKDSDEIRKYLASHLKANVTARSASQVIQGHPIVMVVSAKRSGVGKSLFVQRKRQALSKLAVNYRSVTIRLLENKLNLDYIIEKLCPSGKSLVNEHTILAHVDITPAVQDGVEAFIFNLFILGSIEGSDGKVWRSHYNHLYLVEITDLCKADQKKFSNQHIMKLLPQIQCYAPLDVLSLAQKYPRDRYLGMDPEEFASETFQRPYQYLFHYEEGHDMDDFSYSKPSGSEISCIEILLRHCCINNPSWAQLRHFCSFLNFQLKNCEKSVFCNNEYIKPILAGLKLFAVRFMIKMAQDFATPSLTIADTSMKDFTNDDGFQAHQLRRKWEEASHPYVFFNEDGHSMTFVNVKIDRQGNLLGKNDEILEKIITPELTTALHQQKFDLRKNFDDYSRHDKLRFLCQVLGIENPFDPDPTYELTTDNVLKILAIYTRFKCGIPVIIMGETGCGKTRLVEFMSKLKAGRVTTKQRLENMTTLKIHGGITVDDIYTSVETAIKLERNNPTDYAVLFCDEANTTEAIYAIKEVMCDRSIDGEYFSGSNLKIVAACNPYKRLSRKALKKLEDSGLGYRIRTNKTTHLFGNIPVRSLVYRVVALPPSMQPFVWDFGQLNDEAERIYIQQMTTKLSIKLSLADEDNRILCAVLSRCQQYMRTRTDECRYVSLRDIERCMITFEWFFNKRSIIYPLMTEYMRDKHEIETKLGEVIRTIILTVGVCYHASLDERKPFCEYLAQCLNLQAITAKRIEMEITSCQFAFLHNVRVGNNIARNQALRENVFMMAICTDMKIPLFLVGKPGSSKSLAKTIIANNMQGQTSHSKLYQKLKQIHILSYQCSALTDAEGIKKVFNQCVQLQKKQNLDTYTAVVVLDEIGLAEDSPNMPLKILHPLLERRSTDLTTIKQTDSERVGFIGISNWALDPAKMNRGIFLTRSRPEERDLRKTGKEIFQANTSLWNNNEDLFKELTKTYIEMYKKQSVEYFGLRDYYSLMKMICSRCEKEEVDFYEVVYAVSRNFGGGRKEVIKSFIQESQKCLDIEDMSITDTTVPIQAMIRDNLGEKKSRFLLLLTNQFSIVSLLETCIKNFSNGLQVVFGSSFPGDHSYTEICRNINKIKVCMETGKTVILLNMANIHESLYDALNQHFVTMGKQNFVDLGLGGHRVKCRISNDFRLIVIEKKDVVYQEYPIPLVNRLEKHHFSSESLLEEHKKSQSSDLHHWAKNFNRPQSCFTCQHAFIGYHDDTPSSVIFTSQCDILEHFKETLLQSCSMDTIFRLRDSRLSKAEVEWIQKVYFEQQKHDSLVDVLRMSVLDNAQFSVMEITSFSGILWEKDKEELEQSLDLPKRSITLVPLEQFQTQQEYCNRLDKFFEKCIKNSKQSLILLVQCAQAQLHGSLIACARYCLMNKIRDFHDQSSHNRNNVTVCFLLSTERQGMTMESPNSLVLQHTSESMIIHVDELRPSYEHISPATNFYQKSLQQVFEAGKAELENEGATNQPLVEIKALLIDSIPECVTMIRDSGSKSDERNLERLEILMNLCSRDDNISQHFRKILLKKIVEAFALIAGRFGEGMNWIIEQANDAEILQDSGTFRKAIWLCLKNHMSRFLACIVSIIDRNSNLDVISKAKVAPWEVDLWLGMLQDMDIPWTEMIKTTHYMIKGNDIRGQIGLPFSFIVIDFLESQWKALGSKSDVSFERSFLGLFRDFKMHRVVTNALMFEKATFMKRFVSDVVKYYYKQGTDSADELELVSKVVFDFAMKEFRKLRENEDFKDGDEISVMYATFKIFSSKLDIFSEILHRCPNVLQNRKKWIADQSQDDFCLHISAFKDTLSLLKEKAENIVDPNICVEWIDLAREVKKLYSLIMNDIKNEAVMKEINRDWKPLRLLDLFLLQLLPPAHTDSDLFKKFVKAISPQAKLFWRGSTTCDCRSLRFLRIAVNVLKKCFIDVELQILVNWMTASCKICQKAVKKPVFLPCQHFGCEDCVLQYLAADEKKLKCPVCNYKIPKSFVPTPKQMNQKEKSILMQMKQNCTSFFTEFLRQFCLETENQGIPACRMEPQMKQIIKDIVVEDELDQPELDPVGFDMNFNFKSAILQLLLNYDKTFVEKEINTYLQKTEANSKNSLTIVIMKCYLRKIIRKTVKLDDNETITKYWQGQLQKSWKYLANSHVNLDLKMIEQVVCLRCALCHFGDLSKDYVKAQKSQVKGRTNPQVETFIRQCLQTMNSAPLVVKEFLLKYGGRQFGSQWLLLMTQHREFKGLVPRHLMQAISDRSTDFWVVIGNKYSEIKSLLHQNDPKDYEKEIGNIFNRNQDHLTCVLAAMSWMKEKGQDVHQNVTAILRHKCGNLSRLLDLVFVPQCSLWDVITANSQSEHDALALYQTCIIIIATLLTSNNQMIKGFADVMTNPNYCGNMYLPTMPEHRFFSVLPELRTSNGQNAMYTCPKGHLYTIGDCTGAVTTANCPHCKEKIGGTEYKLATGNQKISMNPETQAGYKHTAVDDNYCTGVERMSPQGHSVTQFILHTCLLTASFTAPGVVCGQLGCRDVKDLHAFLVTRLLRNIQDLARSLAKNEDEATMILIRTALRFVGQGHVGGNWSSLENRKTWEETFCNYYLRPVFQNIDDELEDCQVAIREADRLSSAPLTILMQDVQSNEGENKERNFFWETPILWTIVEHKSIEHLIQVLQDSVDKSEGEVLRIILKSSNIRYLKHLQNVLMIQQKLVERYQFKLDLADAENITFRNHVEQEDVTDEELLKRYIDAWNELTIHLKPVAPNFLVEHLAPLSMDSPLCNVLPSIRGKGQCAKLLAEFLIDIQNNFLGECTEVIKPLQQLKELGVQQLSTNDFVCLDKEKDLTDLIDLHTSYKITIDNENGRQHRTTYNFEALEKQVRERYVLCKKMIKKNTLPFMQYLQDVGIGAEWKELESTLQGQLTVKLCQDIDAAVEKSHSSDVCERVRTLTNAIRFLALVQVDPEKSLHEFLEKDLKIPPSRSSVIPREVQLSQVLSLYKRLTWHKAVIFVKQGHDPYKEALSLLTQEEIPQKLLREARESFERVDVIKLQQTLNEMLITGTAIDDANWSLVEDVFPNLGDDDETWFEKLPTDLCNKHITHLFKETVLYKAND